ncbi:MAG TPA: branched-chain amino acid ABC transporter permease [Gaiellaceae bacterium]|nr:branched-chain amino acid ABC transporter permease [Gaiellaceae bacterium]
MAADVSAPTLGARFKRPSVIGLLGLLFVAALVFWLIVNLIKTPSDFGDVFLIGITNGSVYALIALGYTLVYGILELINFAHGDVFMLAGMFTITFSTHFFGLHQGQGWVTVPIVFATLLLAMLACGSINAAIEFVAYRPLRGAPRLAPLITAIGVSFIIQDIGLAWKGPNYVTAPDVFPHSNVFSAGGVDYSWNKLIVVLVTIPVLLALLWLVQETRQGKAMRATAQDKDAAAIMGINVNRTISFTFLIAGALAGAAGTLYSLWATTVRFDQGFQLGLIAFTAAVLGGIGNLPGAVLGAVLIGLIQAFNEGLNWHAPGSDWTQSIVFSILILILVFRPEGLLGEKTPEGG